MTKFNWERASKNSRYLRALFSQERPVSQKLDFNINREKNWDSQIPNSIGLTEEDCRGRLPDLNKRMKIIIQLLQTENTLKEIYLLPDGLFLNEVAVKAARNFQQFCRLVSFTCDIKSRSSENFWPLAVCFSVFYLSYYNNVLAGKGEKASKLSFEILNKLEAKHVSLNAHYKL
jgi:hypothetical protein